MMWAWNIRHRHARNRSIEIEEGFVGDDGRDLGSKAAGSKVLVDDEAAPGAPDAFKNHFPVPGLQRPKIDDVRLKILRRGLAAWNHCTPGDDRDLVPLPGLFRMPEGQDIIVARPWSTRPAVVEHRAVLEKQDWIVAAKAPAKKADGILGV